MRRKHINVVFKVYRHNDQVLKYWVDAPCAPMIGDTVLLDKDRYYTVEKRMLIPVNEYETTVHCFVVRDEREDGL